MPADPELLADVLGAVVGAADSTEVLDRVAHLLVPRLADVVLADRLDDPDVVTRVAAVTMPGSPTLKGALGGPDARRSSSHAGGMLALITDAPAMVLRQTRAQLEAGVRSSDARRRAQATGALALGIVDLVAIGLASREHVLGVLTFASTTRPFGDDALGAMVQVATVTSLALDNARLLAAQRNVAAAMQTSLLPPLPEVAGLTLAARYDPAAQGLDVGGDWYDAFRLPDGGIAVVIGDVTGHDASAATRMAELRNLLRAVAVDRAEPPAATLTRLDLAAARLGVDASATCLFARLDPLPGSSRWRLRWSSAGHLPLLLHTRGHVELLETPADLMLGIDAGTGRTEHEREVGPGDLLLLCSDGLVEDRTSSLDERLAVLAATVQRHGALDPESLCEVLLSELVGGGSSDDVALLLVRIEDAAVTPT